MKKLFLLLERKFFTNNVFNYFKENHKINYSIYQVLYNEQY